MTEKFGAFAWQTVFACLDRMPVRRSSEKRPQHLRTGLAGEEAALFYLRGLGFTVIAHGWQTGRAPGDLDLVAWDGDVLCFIEVKTRTSRVVATAEASIDFGKRRSLRRMASHYLRQLPEGTESRFDVVSVYFVAGKSARIELFRHAFGWRERD